MLAKLPTGVWSSFIALVSIVLPCTKIHSSSINLTFYNVDLALFSFPFWTRHPRVSIGYASSSRAMTPQESRPTSSSSGFAALAWTRSRRSASPDLWTRLPKTPTQSSNTDYYLFWEISLNLPMSEGPFRRTA
jgi:hypothetical protein